MTASYQQLAHKVQYDHSGHTDYSGYSRCDMCGDAWPCDPYTMAGYLLEADFKIVELQDEGDDAALDRMELFRLKNKIQRERWEDV
jgi:hypothetical protein